MNDSKKNYYIMEYEKVIYIIYHIGQLIIREYIEKIKKGNVISLRL